MKPARNPGGNAPAGFIDDLLDVSDGSARTRIVENERVREPHTGEDKGACTRQAFDRTDFEVTRVVDVREEQKKSPRER
jgi:hypothetical protein